MRAFAPDPNEPAWRERRWDKGRRWRCKRRLNIARTAACGPCAGHDLAPSLGLVFDRLGSSRELAPVFQASIRTDNRVWVATKNSVPILARLGLCDRLNNGEI